MTLSLRKSLILLIALLQLVAPLVHAHADKEINSGGIHVPGLEFISLDSNTPGFHAIASQVDIHGIIISVSFGIKHKDSTFELSASTFIHHEIKPFNDEFIAYEVNFSPPPCAVISQNFYRPSSPRAPPV